MELIKVRQIFKKTFCKRKIENTGRRNCTKAERIDRERGRV